MYPLVIIIIGGARAFTPTPSHTLKFVIPLIVKELANIDSYVA